MPKEKKVPKVKVAPNNPQTYYAVIVEDEPDFDTLHETMEDAVEEATDFLDGTDNDEVLIYQLVPVRRIRMDISDVKL